MSRQKETTLRNKIVHYLKGEGFRVVKIHGGQYQEAGLPDLLAIKEGRAMWLEVKLPGQWPTPIQTAKIRDLQRFGCIACVVQSVDDARRAVQAFDAKGLTPS